MTLAAPTRYFSPADVAERYGCDVHKVLAWIRSGELRAINVAAKRAAIKPRWRINPDNLAAFEAARACSKSEPTPRRQRKNGAQVIEYF
jgi:hypothetical protein